MANLTEASTWDTVYQLESTDQALGGAGGTMNRQAQALLNRTKYLADTKLNTADFKTQINASGSAPVYAARAWVNFNGTGTVSITASGNVSSITDNGVGDYTINFTTAIQDVKYSINLTTVSNAATDCRVNALLAGVLGTGATQKTTTACRIVSGYAHSASLLDSSDISAAIFR